MRSFGCTNKVGPKVEEMCLLSYGTETKGYGLYDPQSSRVMYSRDVKCNESEFEFDKNLSDSEIQANKLVTLELSSQKEDNEKD